MNTAGLGRVGGTPTALCPGSCWPGHELWGTEKPLGVSSGARAVMLCRWCLPSRIQLSIQRMERVYVAPFGGVWFGCWQSNASVNNKIKL